jgi:hypothetical protein
LHRAKRRLLSLATFPKGGIDFEAGIAEMATRFWDGGLNVARHLQEWFQEYRMYRRKEDGIARAARSAGGTTICLIHERKGDV